LHALEVENAIRQRAFQARCVLPANERAPIKRERDAALARVAQYLKRGPLNEVVLDMDSTMDRAHQLSVKPTERLGVRAIDLLHVTCALLLEAEVFLTFDERQFELATAEALEAPALRAAD
jgi:predicted nucleic acid-binding protein